MKGELAERMNRLPEVRWDRCAGTDEFMAVYGWIDREDGRFDFVVLQAVESEAQPFVCWLVTSSARYSRDFQKRLMGTDEGHCDCERVEDVFENLVSHRVMLQI